MKKRIICFMHHALLYTVLHTTTILTLTTLTDLQKYARKVPENVAEENNDWISPDYDYFYYKHLPSIFDKTLALFNIKKTVWEAHAFHTLLHDITEVRTIQKLQGRLVAHRNCQPQDKFFIISNLYGAFHSLVRDLTWLEEQKIIDTSLTITKENHYLIFNGNQINRSPYALETLNTILVLMQRNPEKVFYLRGKQEDYGHWRNFTLKRELIMRAHSVSKEKIPLSSLLSDFFNTLPLALYLSVESNNKEVIRISNASQEDSDIDIHFLGNLFLNTPRNTTVYHNTANKLPTAGKIPDVRAIITTSDWGEGMRTETGLGLLNQDRGSTAWALFSSPVLIHQEKFNFYYDAFGKLNLNSPLHSSTITLYHRDIKKNENFAEAGTFNIITGAEQGAESFDAVPTKEFFIGSSMSLERGVPYMGKYTRPGMLIRINQENIHGGIQDYLLRTIIYNDDYVPYLARKNMRTFIDMGIWLILLPIGSPTLHAYLEYILEKKILVLFPVSGNPEVRKSIYTNMIHVSASYSDEVRALIEYMIQEYSAQKFAFFYQDDAYGRGALATAHVVLKEKGMTWKDIPYTRGATDFSQQAKIIHEVQPDAIGFFSTALAAQNLISNVGIEHTINKQFFGISFLGTVSFRQFIKQYNIPITFGAVVPNPNTSQLPIVQEYREAMHKNNRYYYDVFSLQAYIGTSLLIETLKKITLPFTPEKIIHYLENIKQYDFKGIKLNFNPSQRSLAEEVWIETEEQQEWIRKKIERK